VPATPQAQAQVRAYRFGLRRMDSALLTGDGLLVTDPNRPTRLALGGGMVGAALLVFVCAAVGFIRPGHGIGAAALVLDRDSGALYVVRAGRLYPTLNLASGLMIVGASSTSTGPRPAVKIATAATLRRYPRGPVLGIPGAPDSVPEKADLVPGRWTLCDDTAVSSSPPRPTVLVGVAVPGDLDRTRTLLVRGPNAELYLLGSGRRTRVSTDPPVVRALGISPAAARPVSADLLDGVPQDTPIEPLRIPGAGRPVSYGAGGDLVGSVRRVDRAGGIDHYLLLADGVQQISELMADLVRFTVPHSGEIRRISPARIAAMPTTRHPLHAPAWQTAPRVIDGSADPVVCTSWDAGAGSTEWALSARPTLPLPLGAAPLRMPGGGSVYVPPGHGAVVTASGISQVAYLITDEGVRFPVHGDDVLRVLALAGTVRQVPAALLNLLPVGPTLDPAAANTAWPTLPAPSTSTVR
jgi:type VII secretion protein EccB